MAKIGYVRVSTTEQNEERQIISLKEQGVEKMFIDKLSGKDTKRPELQKMLEYIREGDTLIVSEYSRLARSTQDLLNLVKQLTDKGVQVISLKENLDTSTPQGKLMLTVFAALAEFERELTLQRQREGITLAKEQGKYKGRQPIPFDEKQLHRECKKWVKGEQTAVATMKKLGMKPNRFYRVAKKYGYSKGKNKTSDRK
ncbi:MAG: recombinase family protein [Lachnospiraceae bacterium]